ncbi:MAG: sensor domain-containing diguanylate cyclase [Candidatus Omnitrophota bacterium]|nr:sensor domain-containing diguanylate cyclase [Candidatus Omnitrophota bacterium]
MSKNRPALRVISIASFLATSYLIFAAPHRINPLLSSSHYLLAGMVLSFNIAILLSWAGFGMAAGVIFTILSFFVGLAGVLRSGCYVEAHFTWSFIISALIGYGHWKAIRAAEGAFSLRQEKIEEDINMLSDTYNKQKAEVKHLDGRLLRYLVLKDVTEIFTTTLSLEKIASLIIKRAVSTVEKPGRILLFLVDVDKQELMLSASSSAAKIKDKNGDIFDRWVVKHGIPLIVDDAANDFRFSNFAIKDSKDHFKSIIITPLLSGNKIIGILRMDDDVENAYTQDDLRLLDIIGNLGAVAIQNAMLYARTQELAIRDSLTGLFVRRFFLKRFQEEMRRAERKGGELSLLMIDIDKFKWYNDKYGHATGDIVLKYIASMISGMLREGDMAARYGGEEIAILLTGADKKKALGAAESIRKKIEETPFSVRREKHIITASIGVSTYPEDGIHEEELVKIADEHLYRAKSGGRNRVCAE